MKETASYQAVESLTRYASRVPAFEIESSDPTNTATNVPVNKTITKTKAASSVDRSQKLKELARLIRG